MLLSTLGALGFECAHQRDLALCLAVIADCKGERREGTAGYWKTWRAPTGAELILRFRHPPLSRSADEPVTALTDLVGVTPFHSGQGAVAVTPISDVGLEAGDPMGGAWRVALAPDRYTGHAPEIAVEIVPFQPLQPGFLERGPTRTLQIVALCSQMASFPDLAGYLTDLEPRLLAPPGTLCDAPHGIGPRRDPLRRSTLITGVARNCQRHTNPLTGRSYDWVLVATERGLVDCMAAAGDQALAAIGSLVCCVGYLVGRATERVAMPCDMPVARCLGAAETVPANATMVAETRARPRRQVISG